ncbi:MAG: response regulator transcription factor [Armatimonadota bacterium]|nr:response regulator transcription factor [Armatimonadota bacterium]
MAKIFVIEDDRTIAELLQVALAHEGHEVHLEPSGTLSALDATYDLVLLDLSLPDAEGLDLARRIRREHRLPIIMVTARGQTQDKVAGFDAGADDYVTKPFSFEELAARIRAVLARAGRERARLETGPLVVDMDQRTAWWVGAPLALTRREFDLLATLARRPGRVYSRDELVESVWGFDFNGESNVVEATIRRLRDRLGDRTRRIVVTVRGAGYTLKLP